MRIVNMQMHSDRVHSRHCNFVDSKWGQLSNGVRHGQTEIHSTANRSTAPQLCNRWMSTLAIARRCPCRMWNPSWMLVELDAMKVIPNSRCVEISKSFGDRVFFCLLPLACAIRQMWTSTFFPLCPCQPTHSTQAKTTKRNEKTNKTKKKILQKDKSHVRY